MRTTLNNQPFSIPDIPVGLNVLHNSDDPEPMDLAEEREALAKILGQHGSIVQQPPVDLATTIYPRTNAGTEWPMW